MKAVIFSLCVFFNASVCFAEINSGDVLRATISFLIPNSTPTNNTIPRQKSSTVSAKTKKPTTQPSQLTKEDIEKIFPGLFQSFENPKNIEPKTTRQLEYPAIAKEKYDVTHSNLGRKLRAYWNDEIYGTKAPELYSMPERAWYGFLYYLSWIPVIVVYVIDLLLLIVMFVIFGVILWIIDGLFWSWMAITGLGILLGTRKS